MSHAGLQYTGYTEEQRLELAALSRPLIKWINDNCHPHNEIVINHHTVEILEGQMCITIPDYLKD